MGLELTSLPRSAVMQLCAAPRLSGSLRCPGMGLADGEEKAGMSPDTPAAAGRPYPGLQPDTQAKGLSQCRARPHPWYLRVDPSLHFCCPGPRSRLTRWFW